MKFNIFKWLRMLSISLVGILSLYAVFHWIYGFQAHYFILGTLLFILLLFLPTLWIDYKIPRKKVDNPFIGLIYVTVIVLCALPYYNLVAVPWDSFTLKQWDSVKNENYFFLNGDSDLDQKTIEYLKDDRKISFFESLTLKTKYAYYKYQSNKIKEENAVRYKEEAFIISTKKANENQLKNEKFWEMAERKRYQSVVNSIIE